MTHIHRRSLVAISIAFVGLACAPPSTGGPVPPPAPTSPAPVGSEGKGGAGAIAQAATSVTSSTGQATPVDGTSGAGGANSTSHSTKTVLLIPGTAITGDYFDTMAARLMADGFQPRVFVPPDLFTDSLALGAQRIADEVTATLAATGEDRVHIVAECDGGVATRYYVEVLGGAAHVDQMVTFVSAHHGTITSPIGQVVTGWQAMSDITPGSPFLEQLNSIPFPTGLKMTSIYTCHDEFISPYQTSVVDGATNVLFCQHYIAHLDGFWDSVVYARILAALRGEGASAPTQY